MKRPIAQKMKDASELSVRRMKFFAFSLVVFWFALDQAAKWWILEYVMNPPRAVPVTPFFDLVLGWNRGISFGMLGGRELPPWTLALLSTAIATGFVIWLLRSDNRIVATGLALIIGGALGNALDRMRHGAVTDFLDFHLAGWHWPAFNLADVGVVVGAALLIVDSFVRRDQDATQRRPTKDGNRAD